LDAQEGGVNSKSYWFKVLGALLALGAIVGLWFGDEYYTEKEAEEKKIAEKAVSFKPEDVRQFSVTVPESGTSLTFVRADASAEWSFGAPHEAIAADQDAVNNFLTAINDLRRERELAEVDEGKLQEFRLQQPRRTLKLKLANNQELGLDIGGDVGVGRNQGVEFKALSVYARALGAKKLLVIPSSALSATDKSFADFRTRKVARFKRDEVEQVDFNGPAGGFSAARKDGQWQIAASDGKVHTGDANAIGLYVDRMERLRADSVVEKAELGADGLANLGLAVPRVTVSFKKGDGTVLQDVAIGLNEKNVHAIMADGAIARVPLDQFTDLVPDMKSLRDLRVMAGLDFSKIQGLVTTKGNGFRKDGQRWFPAAAVGANAADPATKAPDESLARSEAATLVSDFEFMRASDIVDPENVKADAEYGLDRPTENFAFEFSQDSAMKRVQVTVGARLPSDDKKVYLKREGSQALFVVDAAWMDALKALDDPAKSKPVDSGGEASPQAKKGD
jgi:hypothetical protein